MDDTGRRQRGSRLARNWQVANHHCYYRGMKRTTISLPDELLQRLRLIAAERRTSIASLIREALEEKARSYRPPPRRVGVGASGHVDTARRSAEERVEPRSWR